MKKIILILMIFLSALINTSCITPLETEYVTVGYNDVYVYAGISYPVYYIDHIAYYWSLNQWIVVPTINYHLIRHFDHPRYFSGYYPKMHHDIYRRPHTRHSMYNHNDFRRHNIHRQNNGFRNDRLNHQRYNNNVRPNNRPNNRPNIGNRQFGGRR